MTENSNQMIGRWTAREHLLFEQGYKKFGWGNWNEISTMIPSRTRTQVKSHGQKLLRNRDNEEFRKQVEKERSANLQLQQQKKSRRKKDRGTSATSPSTSTAMPNNTSSTSSATELTLKSATAKTPFVNQAVQRGVGTPVVHIPNQSRFFDETDTTKMTTTTTQNLIPNSTSSNQPVARYYDPNVPWSPTQQLVCSLLALGNQSMIQPVPTTASGYQATLCGTTAASSFASSHQPARYDINKTSSDKAALYDLNVASSHQGELYALNLDESNQAMPQSVSCKAPVHQAELSDPTMAPSNQAALIDHNQVMPHFLVPNTVSSKQAMPHLVSNQTPSKQTTQLVGARYQPVEQYFPNATEINSTIAHSVSSLMAPTNQEPKLPVRRITMQSITIPSVVHTSTDQKSLQRSHSNSPENQEPLPVACDGSPRYLNEEISLNHSCISSVWSPYPFKAPESLPPLLRLLTREQHHGIAPVNHLARYYLSSTYISGFPTNYDVLCDHVNDVYCNHVGNRRLRIMAMTSLCEFKDSMMESTVFSFTNNVMKKRDDAYWKRHFILEFIHSLTACNPPCRFLAMDVSVGRWRELNGEYSIMKIQETFRECKEVMEQSILVHGHMRL